MPGDSVNYEEQVFRFVTVYILRNRHIFVPFPGVLCLTNPHKCNSGVVLCIEFSDLTVYNKFYDVFLSVSLNVIFRLLGYILVKMTKYKGRVSRVF